MPSRCLRCQTPVRLGTLCPEHASLLASADTLIAEHLVAKGQQVSPVCLVDQWGRVHPVGDRYRIGRNPEESDLAILHPSVSGVHAEIRQVGGDWELVDLGSLNGTKRNGNAHTRGPVTPGDLLQFGEVSLFFVTQQASSSSTAAGTPGSTVPTKQRELGFEVVIRCPAGDLQFVQRPGGGIVSMVGGESSVELARLEFALLMLLAERSQSSTRSDLAYVSTSDLVSSLDFRSRDADTDNVRELIRRVRRKLKALTSDPIIESRQGAGYRLAWPVLSAS